MWFNLKALHNERSRGHHDALSAIYEPFGLCGKEEMLYMDSSEQEIVDQLP